LLDNFTTILFFETRPEQEPFKWFLLHKDKALPFKFSFDFFMASQICWLKFCYQVWHKYWKKES